MFDQVLTNTVTTIEAVTPDDKGHGYGATYVHYEGNLSDASKTAASDRRFSVIPDDGIELLDSISASATLRVKKTVWVLIQYRVGKSLSDFNARLHKDVDRLVYNLYLPTNYANGSGWALLSRLPAPQFFVELDESATSAIVHLPFELTYEVTYS